MSRLKWEKKQFNDTWTARYGPFECEVGQFGLPTLFGYQIYVVENDERVGRILFYQHPGGCVYPGNAKRAAESALDKILADIEKAGEK